jgi:elongation factor G
MVVPRTRIRNIGISAHIDSGKTTLSERILFYTGRIHAIEEVRGGGKGATMDFDDLEREHGITISSAATSCQWQDTQINLIDTPGHIDFTIEVERALRVLDGAVMVLCAVAGVQSQSITVDRQMKRYGVPRIAFINKMDRIGANPFKVVEAMHDALDLNALLLEYPIGAETEFEGVIDLIGMEAHFYEGENGEIWVKREIPDDLKQEAETAREKMLDTLSLFSEEMTEKLVEGEEVSKELICQTIRQATLNLQLVPVLLGSAFKNKGVQNLLDAVSLYLPSPVDKDIVKAKDVKTDKTVDIRLNSDAPFVALAFKLTMESFGQFTYIRVYSGILNQGDTIYNSRTGEKVQVGRLVRIHADKREIINQAVAGDIVALLGVDCASGDTFCSSEIRVSLEDMFVPEPVITLAIEPKKDRDFDRISKALNRFQKEDPTFRVKVDKESNETLISGMGELHLEIYIERMKREYNLDIAVGKPKVSYREAISQRATFDYKLKKQTSGPGQYAHVVGYIEPCEEQFVFENKVFGGAIPKEYIAGVEKGFLEAMNLGMLERYPVMGVKIVLENGSYHMVDSSEFAFRMAAQQAFTQAFLKAKPHLLQPIMQVEVETPDEYLGRVQGDLSARRGLLLPSRTMQGYSIISAEVPLTQMFGYSGKLRSLTSGMATFTMQFSCYRKR